ncbi:2-hydroxyacid dehydrogenase [Mycetocola spongiae]|uniref:2-hydroxyacid dehydrogenase n=1 Tax=Mycetocola spongiae TaxID=2859226 RepID=UPI001CF43FAF|nr:2-hydroxyacid dehydrogenase [Mycetocola spongiae]UCR88147.1 2-hydroxyacid dehydrogenase [Mycetocola spongiae]
MTPPELLVTVPGATLLTALGPVPKGVEVRVWDLASPAPAEHINIVVPPYMGIQNALAALAPITTDLVQSQSIGYDGVAEALPPGHTFANAASVHEASTAELTLGLILAVQRNIVAAVRASESGSWAPLRSASLADRRVLIVGYGGVGQAIEERLIPFEVEVTRVARSARGGLHGPILALDELPGLLPAAEIVILAVPLTEETRGLADAAFLAALPDGALLVNIARGPVLDTAAALAEARSGRLRFALDVTDPEPLPADHPLWALENVLITPHVGGASTAMMPRMAALLHRQIAHLRAGDPVENIVIRA